VAALAPEEREFMEARTAFLQPERSESSGVLLLVTMALFALSMTQGESTWKEIALLVAVVLFHELGHWVGMRLFGFQDVKMFFIPFMGAAVSGRNVSAVAWKEALVLLMGPMPGLLLGCVVLLFASVDPSPLLSSAGLMLVGLNAFNLLPLTPLDGGKLFQLLIFSRHRYLEILFSAFAGLALLGLGLVSSSWVMAFLAVMVLLSISRQRKVLSTAQALRAGDPAMAQEPAALGDSSLRSLYTAVEPMVPKQGKPDVVLTHRVRAMRDVHHRVRLRPPSVLASLGLFVIWFFGVIATVMGLLLSNPDSRMQMARWSTFTDEKGGFSVLMPLEAPLSEAVAYGTRVGGQLDGATLRGKLWLDHDYSVTYWKLDEAQLPASERDRLLEELRGALVKQAEFGQSAPTLDTEWELNGIHGRHLVFSGPSKFGDGKVTEEYWLGLHQGRGYILRAEHDSNLATPKEVESFFTSFKPLP
jgi:Zn-dependent protease